MNRLRTALEWLTAFLNAHRWRRQALYWHKEAERSIASLNKTRGDLAAVKIEFCDLKRKHDALLSITKIQSGEIRA